MNSLKTGLGRIIKPSLTGIFAILIVLIPKCPMCWAAYMSTFSSLGLGTIEYHPAFIVVLLSLLVASLGYMLYKGIKSSFYLPFILMVVGAGLILLNKYATESSPLMVIGLCIVLLGSIWQVNPAWFEKKFKTKHSEERSVCNSCCSQEKKQN